MARVEHVSFLCGCATALLTVIAAPTAAQDQFVQDCKEYVDELTRNSQGKNQLAVKTNEGWQFFPPNDSASPHDLAINGRQRLCLAWEAPPHSGSNVQIVYASTQYRDDQPVLLFRRSWADRIPVINRLVGEFERQPGPSGYDPDDAFRWFHMNPSYVQRNSVPWSDLYAWHVWTWFWRANQTSYDFASSAVHDVTRLPLGTERLLRLVPNRELASWVAITTRVHPSQTLRVAVSYSGDMEPLVYQYEFKAR